MHTHTHTHTHVHPPPPDTHTYTHTHTHTKYKWYHAKEGLNEGRGVLFLSFCYSHLSIHAVHGGKRRTLTWVVNLVQQLDGASGHHAAQAHNKAGREGTHGEERKLLHTHTHKMHSSVMESSTLYNTQTWMNRRTDRWTRRVQYTPLPPLYVCVCWGGGGDNNNNNNNNILYSSQREIKAVVHSHNEEHISIILSHETHAHTHS